MAYGRENLVEVQEAEGLKVGDEFTNHVQPYGTYTIRVTRIYTGQRDPRFLYGRKDPRFWELEGVVVEGKETSRLFQYTSTKDIQGQHRTVYGVEAEELAKGSKITAVCG